MSVLFPRTNEPIRADFTVKNVGTAAILVEALTAGVRRGANWSDANADFPTVNNIVLAPGQEYVYVEVRSFDTPGMYFAEAVAKISGKWGGIRSANRVEFMVVAQGQLEVSVSLQMSEDSPRIDAPTRAAFTVKNIGTAAILVEALTAGVRRGANWSDANADFPTVNNIVLAPGQEYVYVEVRSFDTPGMYFAEAVAKISGKWGGIRSANRVQFIVE